MEGFFIFQIKIFEQANLYCIWLSALLNNSIRRRWRFVCLFFLRDLMNKLKISLTALAFLLGGVAVAGTVRVPFETTSAAAGAGSGATLTVAMGDLAVGMFGYKTVTYTNTTSGYINITNIETSDPVSLYSGTCGLMVPGASCDLTFAMIIGQEGSNTGVAKIYATKQSSAVVDTFNFSANGVPASTVFSVTPNGAAFTFSGETKLFTIKNIQSFPVSVDYVQPSTKYWTVSNSTCSGVMPVGAECTFIAKYVATKAGTNKADLKLFVDSIPYVTVPVSGSMVLGNPSFNLDQMSFTGAKANLAQKKGFTLINSGQGKLVINSVQMLGDSTFSISANDCPAILEPGLSCNIEIKSLFNSANKSANGTVQFSFLNAGQSTAIVGVQGDSYTGSKALNPSPGSLFFNPVLAGQTSTATLTLSSIGADAVTITDATVSGAGSVSLDKSACIKSMAPGDTCNIVATYTGAVTDGSQIGTINIVSDSDPTIKVGYTGTTLSTSIVTNPIQVGITGDNSAALSQTVTVTNNSSFNTTIKSATISGNYFSVSNNTCAAELMPGKTCTIDVNITTPVFGSSTASLALSYSSGTATKSLTVPVSSNISAVGLTLSAFACTTSDVGVDGTCSATLTNPSAAAVNITALTSDSKSFGTPTIVGSTTFPVSLGAKQTKTVSVPYKFTAEGSYSANVTVKNPVKDVVGVASVVTKTITSATGTLSNFSCPSAVVGVPVTCTATLTNTSTSKPLAVGAITKTGSDFSMTHNCTASLAASKSCVITLNITPSAERTYTTDVNVVTNPILTKTAIATASFAKIEVTSPAQGKIAPGATTTYNVVYKNVGIISVDLSKANKTVTGIGYSFVSTTCNATLAPGQSCAIVAKFSSVTTATSLKGFANLDVSGKVYTGTLDTAVLQEKITVTRMPGVTSFAGFKSGSGNKYTVTNNGLQAQTLTFAPAASTVIGFDSTDPSPCKANIALAPDKSCTFYDSVSVATMPTSSTLISGVGYVRGTSPAAASSWSANYKMVPPTAVLTGLNNPANLGEKLSAVLKVSNPTSSALKNVSIAVAATPTTAQVTLGSAACLASIEAGQTCDVPVSLIQNGTADVMLSLNFTISGAYATERNAVIVGTGEKVVQAKYTYSSKFSIPLGSWATGTYPLTGRDQTNNAMHTFTNMGTTTITVSSIDLQTAASSNQTIFADNCTGQVLTPKKTCTVTTSFSVVPGVIEYKPADIILTAASGHTWKGTIVANPTGKAFVDIAGTGCTGGMLYPVASSPTIKLNATLGSAYTCLVTIKNVGGGFLTFAAPTVYLRQLSDTPGETLNGQVPFDKSNPYADYKAMAPKIPQPVNLVSSTGSPLYLIIPDSKPKQLAVQNVIFYEDGSRFIMNPPNYVLAPGATVKVGVPIGYCTRTAPRQPCVIKPGNYDFDMFITSGNLGGTGVTGASSVVARYKMKFNMGAPLMETQSNANIPVTNLEGGQSVTYNFINNDVEALPIGVAFFNYWPNTGSLALNQYISSGYRKNLKTGVDEYYGVNGLDGFVTATNCTTKSTGPTPFVGAMLNPGQACYIRHSCLTDNDLGVSARNLALNAWQTNQSSTKFVLESGNKVSTRKPSDYMTYLPDKQNPSGAFPGFSEVNYYPQLNGQPITSNALKCTLK